MEHISRNVAQDESFFIIADSTPDISKKEIIALSVQYLESNECGQLAPVERLMSVFSSASTSGKELKGTICEIMSSVELPTKLLVG